MKKKLVSLPHFFTFYDDRKWCVAHTRETTRNYSGNQRTSHSIRKKTLIWCGPYDKRMENLSLATNRCNRLFYAAAMFHSLAKAYFTSRNGAVCAFAIDHSTLVFNEPFPPVSLWFRLIHLITLTKRSISLICCVRFRLLKKNAFYWINRVETFLMSW